MSAGIPSQNQQLLPHNHLISSLAVSSKECEVDDEALLDMLDRLNSVTRRGVASFVEQGDWLEWTIVNSYSK